MLCNAMQFNAIQCHAMHELNVTYLCYLKESVNNEGTGATAQWNKDERQQIPDDEGAFSHP